MFLCPITSVKLRSAFARGVNIWYSPESGGRMITFSASRKILGTDISNELWVRSGLNGVETNWKKCPSCSHHLRIVKAPQWAGSYEVDVCRNCHLIWLDKTDFPAVPVPEDLITPYGDASLVTAVAHDQANVLLAMDKKENQPLFGEGPSSVWKAIPAFVGMPVEMEDDRKNGIGWMTWMLAILMLMFHFFVTSTNSTFLESWSFIPSQFGRHFGLTMFSWGFIHADWFHLLSNLYFFGVFADDVEVYYGQTKFLILIFFCLLFSSSLLVVTQYHADIPHVGISGVICALMVNYGLIYRKSRIAFMIPYMHSMGSGMFVRVMSWVRISSLWVILAFVLKDLFYFFLFEQSNFTRVSHSGHLIGALVGFGFWLMNGRPNWYCDSLPDEKSNLKERLYLPYK